MNAVTPFSEAEAVKLTVPYLALLESFGAFDQFWKVELLDGELWGVAAEGDFEPESDETFPIKLTGEQFELLDRAGAFLNHHRTELLDGRVYAMSPQYRPHGFIKDQLAYRLRRALEELGSPLHVATKQSVSLGRFSEPLPDIILTTEPKGLGAIPGDSVALLGEVADSTSKYDRVKKATLYASAAVPEYWIADVTKRVILRMGLPERGLYTERDTIAFGEVLRSITVQGLAVAIEEL